MVYSTNISIAFKDGLGLYKVENTTLFKLNTLQSNFPVTGFIKQGKEISFTVKCPICDECHQYIYRSIDFIKREIIIGGCENTGSPVFAIGNQIKVIKFISRYNEINKQVYAML